VQNSHKTPRLLLPAITFLTWNSNLFTILWCATIDSH